VVRRGKARSKFDKIKPNDRRLLEYWSLNKSGRTKAVSDFIKTNRLDFVGFQETKKADFTANNLQLFDKHMSWHFMPAKGSAGGILVSFKTPTCDVLSWQYFEYCSMAIVKNQIDKLNWRLIVVCGPPYEETKLDFVRELHMVMGLWQGTWSVVKKIKAMV
jgi:hypothetical protein